MTTTQRMDGRRVLLTGASSGVGLAAACLFAEEGAELALVARRARQVEELLDERGVDAVVIEADLAERDQAERAVEQAVAALGGLDVVVSNAAAAVFGHVLEADAGAFDRTVDVTFRGAVDVVRAALPHLRESRGVIVATGSLNARLPLPTWSSYAASKHALRGFLNTLRIEEREQGTGVEVAMVHPGPIDTPFFSQATSASGRMPRVPPDAYAPDTVAQALVEVAIRPRPEVVLGGETRLVDVLFTTARPVAETLLLMIDRWYRSGDADAPQPGALWQTPAQPQLSGGIPSRGSLVAPLQLGRKLVPGPATPLRLARHLAAAGRRAFELRGALTRPVPERSRPTLASRQPEPQRVASL